MKNQIYSSPNTTNQIMTGNSYEITHYRDKYLKEVDLHSHDFYELYYFISGKVSYVIDNMEYLLLPGDILLISPDNLHRPSFYENLEYERIVLWINPKYVRSLSSKTTNLGICFNQSAKEKSFLIRDYIFSEKIKDVLVDLEQLKKQENEYGFDIKQEIYIKEILLLLSDYVINNPKRQYSKKTTQNKTILKVTEYIDNNLKEDLSIETISKKFYISKYYLLHLFKKETETSMHNYITKKRLVFSKRKIEQGNKLEDVAYLVGFKDYTSFYRAFKEEFGITPKEYKQVVTNKS